MIGQFIAVLFLARELAHREHLRTKSYAQHMALGDFYEGVIGLADSLRRNREHLKIMLAKDFWTTEDLAPLRDASA